MQKYENTSGGAIFMKKFDFDGKYLKKIFETINEI